MKKHRTGRVSLPTIAAVLAITLTLFACEDKEKKQTPAEAVTVEQPVAEAEAAAEPTENIASDVKLLEFITNKDGDVLKKFVYDKQSRIVKIYNNYSNGNFSSIITITYSTDNLVKVETINNDGNIKYTEEFVRNGNTIESTTGLLTINEEGYIVKDGRNTYEYKNSNLTIIQDNSDDERFSSYSYDNKRSPFFNTTTPKWLIQRLFDNDYHSRHYQYASKNNVISSSRNGGELGGIGCDHKYQYDKDRFPVAVTQECDGTETVSVQEITKYSYSGSK